MKFSAAVLSAFLAVGGVSSFSQKPASAFIQSRSSTSSTASPAVTANRGHSAACGCAACSLAMHPVSCACAACGRSRTMLFSAVEDTAEETVAEAAAVVEVPVEVEALDGIESKDEAHNADRPARKSLAKKAAPKGTPLADLKIGDSVKGKVKTITNYGAFMDIGAETDALLHISNLSTTFVSDVKEIIKAGEEYDLRILSVDAAKKQVALTLLTEEQEEEAAASQSRPSGGAQRQAGGGGGRRDDSGTLKQLVDKGWETTLFVKGTVVSTVDFGAFVRVDFSQLNAEVTGEVDGLVHISALAAGRVNSVEAIVKVGQEVQVRCKSIDGRKVSLSMVSVEDEALANESRGGGGSYGGEQAFQGAKDWKESLEKMQTDQPTFTNKPIITDSRK